MNALLWGRERLTDEVKVVVLLEGEKDADTAHAFGKRKDVAYVSGPGGAGNDALDWSALRALPNLEKLYVFFDADTAGREGVQKYGRRAMRELPNVKVRVHAANGSTGKDLSDADDARAWLETHLREAKPVKETPGTQPVDEYTLPKWATENELADWLIQEHKESARWIRGSKTWIVRTKAGLWLEERTSKLERSAKRLTEEKARAVKLRRKSCHAAGIAIAGHELGINPEDRDSDTDLLGTPGGVWSLSKGRLLESDELKGKYITKSLPVTPAENEPRRFLQFIDETTSGNAEYATYILRLMAYSLTGNPNRKLLPYLHGERDTGKSTFMKVLVELAGSYGKPADFSMFLDESNPLRTADAIHGCRVVVMSEPPDGARWNSGLVKNITGGEPVMAEAKYAHPFTYQPQMVLWCSGNHLPRVDGRDSGMLTRLRVCPFEYSPPELDLELYDKLRAEYRGILYYLLDLARDISRAEITTPRVVQVATEKHFRQSRYSVSAFVEDCIQRADPDAFVTWSEIWIEYGEFCRDLGLEVSATERKLGQYLSRCGYESDTKWVNGETRKIRWGLRIIPKSERILTDLTDIPRGKVLSARTRGGAHAHARERLPGNNGKVGKARKCATCALTGEASGRAPCLTRYNTRTPDCSWES
ncbi:MAG: phage/plasmid primase, P4 family [Candidatus Poribacteria bacterium]|nr:phage/plasmid primase, P4 family [Candidatus Poribacteria bacterium]